MFVEAAIEKYSTKIGVKKFGMHYIKVVLELWLQHLKIPVTELLKNDLFQIYFSRTLATRCEPKLDSKVRLVF